MTTTPTPPNPVANFIQRWQASSATERANYQLFLSELCDALQVPRPNPSLADDSQNAYTFEKPVTFHHPDGSTSTGRIDLYKRGHFVLEAKQGAIASVPSDLAALLPQLGSRRKGAGVRGTKGWDDAMLCARGQAESYIRALPDDNPPFLIVVDVGHSIELYSDFSRLGKTYTPYPDALSHRVFLKDFANDKLRDRLKNVWTDPLALDPARRTAKVTREIAANLAELAKSLEKSGHHPETVATFLMRCLFTLFAEDVGLIKDHAFATLLESTRPHPEQFPHLVRCVWREMDKGDFSVVLRQKLLRFNGGLFENSDTLPLTAEQLELLIQAAKADWQDVEPAIFGTLLERALSPIERHQLGAHYTPRAYVERLVLPTIIEPLREDWSAAQTAAVTLAKAGKTKEAIAECHSFLKKLCNVIVLDPACGTANFLYVTLEHLKRLEGEIRDQLKQFGESQADLEYFGLTVDPHQLRGIELNPRAAAIADLVLWIGYLQWHFRTHGNTAPAEPVLKAFHNIECRDAVLAYDKKELATDENGKPISRWDGRTNKKHAVTGEDVPDDSAQSPVWKYINPRKAEWPKAAFIVGNPPFIGNKRMRDALGDGYVDALRKAWQDVPNSADFVMYWWAAAADVLGTSKANVGFITTNSITQSFNRRVLDQLLAGGNSIVWATPDHPWVDSSDGADVRVAMTACLRGTVPGSIALITEEKTLDDGSYAVTFKEHRGIVHSDLTCGVDLGSAKVLLATCDICVQGVIPLGQGFVIDKTKAVGLGCGRVKGLADHIRPYRNGKDVTQHSRDAVVIDLEGLEEAEVRQRFPAVYQHILNTVKPERDQNREPYRKINWWKFGRKHTDLRNGLRGLSRYIVTVKTAKHRVFQFLTGDILPDSKLYAVVLDDAAALGTLSSTAHVTWATAVGGWLGVGNDPTYNNADCFEKFPFPACTEPQKQKIRELGEALDAHRKRQQAAYPDLTLTDMYNVLEKLRSLETPSAPPSQISNLQSPILSSPSSLRRSVASSLSPKEKLIHEHGLISVLKQIHDDLDAAVFDAYGWPSNLTDEQILEKLVELNKVRAEEESRGIIRYLRPDFQNPKGVSAAAQQTFNLPEPGKTHGQQSVGSSSKTRRSPSPKPQKLPWPDTLAEQAKALRTALASQPKPVTPDQLAKTFARPNLDRIEELLETLVSLGQARQTTDGTYTQ